MKINRLSLVLFFLCNIAISLLAPQIRDTAYSTWSNLPPVQRAAFAHRMDLAMANPIACGTGSCGLQGVATSVCSPDTDAGAGLCTDVNGVLAGMATTNAELHTWSAAQTYSAATPATYTNGMTGSATLAAAGSGASTANLTWNTTDTACTGTGTNLAYGWAINSLTPVQINCNGKIFGPAGLSITGSGTFSNGVFASNSNIQAQGTTNGNGEILSGNCTAISGAKGIGAICANGMPYSGTFCSIANGTTTNASPSLLTTLTTGQWNCKITSGSAGANVFNISVPGAVTLTNPAICDFTTSGASAVEPIVTSTTQLCVLTYAVAPGAVLLGTLIMMGNGP